MTKLAIGNVGKCKVAGSSGQHTDIESLENATARNALGDGECTLTGDSFKPMHA